MRHSSHFLKSLCQQLALLSVLALMMATAILPSSTALAATKHSQALHAFSSQHARSAHTRGSVQVSGKGKGTATLPQISFQERQRRLEMLQRMHLPLPQIPLTPETSFHPAVVPATQVRSQKIGTTPHAPITAAVHDLGNQTTSQVNEPSIATDGTNLLQTWNWYSAISTNSGSSWTYYNPVTLFPNDYGGWCCDSVAIYAGSRNLFVWDLLYLANASGGAYRLAVANGPGDLSNASFHYWDLTSQQTGGNMGELLDYPKIAISNNALYLQANVYAGKTYLRTVVMRFALDDLAGGGTLNYTYFNTPGVFSVAFSQGATSTMYFASHLSNSQLRVFHWDESSSTIFWNDIDHVSYPGGAESCPRAGVGNSDWCARSDARMLEGWVSNGIIGFSWNAPQGQWGFQGSAPYPYTDIVRIDQNTLSHIDDPIVWNASFAFMYMSHYPNASGDLGGTFLYGGDSLFESAGVYIWDNNGRDFTGLVAGTQDAQAGGDYLTTRAVGTIWDGTIYTPLDDGIHTLNVFFGR